HPDAGPDSRLPGTDEGDARPDPAHCRESARTREELSYEADGRPGRYTAGLTASPHIRHHRATDGHPTRHHATPAHFQPLRRRYQSFAGAELPAGDLLLRAHGAGAATAEVRAVPCRARLD